MSADRFPKFLVVLFLAGWLACFTLPLRAQAATSPLTVTPSADAYVYETNPTTNYGTSTSLRVDNSPIIRSYLRFSVSGTSGGVTNATLKIYANSSLSAGFAVNALADNTWGETTINYSNSPAPGAVLKNSGAVTSGAWVSIDITSYITGDGTYNLALTPLSSTNLNLSSRESGSHAPQLVVTFGSGGGGGPTNTPTSTPKAAPTNTPTPTPTTIAPSPTPTSSGGGGTGTVPHFSHVVVLIFENHEYTSVIGSSSMPNFNNLANQYTLLTQSYAVRHPSLPNYIALTSGDTQGITTDCSTCYVNATNIADSVEGAGRSWKGYMEDMPSPCYSGSSSGKYAKKHNPFLYYDDIRTNAARCQAHDVPLTQLDTDLQNGSLPNFAWITPNLCNDGHDCSLATADAFLGPLVSKITSSPAWDANSLLILTFDEGSSSASCCGLPSSAGGHIATVLVSPLVKNGYKDSTPYSHYSILKTLAKSWGMSSLGHAADSATNVISAPWK
jgi:hypothetical protein